MKSSVQQNSGPWWRHAVFYSTYVDKFAGTFSGFAQKQKLDYLKCLGIDCIHVLPFYPSPMIDDGYDVSDYCNVRPELGTFEDFSSFVQEAHKAGIRIMIDLVLNHTSTQHPWFLEARSSANNRKRNFYLWSKTGKEYAGAANPFAEAKPEEHKATNWIYNPATHDYFFSTFYHAQADINWNNPEVFSTMMRIVDFWADCGIDGFRFDAVSHIIKKEGTSCIDLLETHAVLKKIRAYFDEHHLGLALLGEGHGESFGRDSISILKEYFGKGDEFHLTYNFPLVGQLFLALKKNDVSVMKEIVEKSRGIPENCEWSTFLRHHDQMAISGLLESERDELFDYFHPEKKYLYNYGLSLRLATMLRGDKQKILDAFRLLFGVPGSPIIYYGDEIGARNVPIAPGEKDTRRAVRGKFDWTEADAQKSDPDSLLNGLTNIIKIWRQGGAETTDEISPAAPHPQNTRTIPFGDISSHNPRL